MTMPDPIQPSNPGENSRTTVETSRKSAVRFMPPKHNMGKGTLEFFGQKGGQVFINQAPSEFVKGVQEMF
jgi:hypothetical protein